MKRISLLMVLSALVLMTASILYAHGSGSKEKTTTVKGEVVDLACYLDHGAKGARHKACALRCVKGGQPMGLLTSDGTVYLLMADHDDGSAFEATKGLAAAQVQITGELVQKAGIKGISVKAVKKL